MPVSLRRQMHRLHRLHRLPLCAALGSLAGAVGAALTLNARGGGVLVALLLLLKQADRAGWPVQVPGDEDVVNVLLRADGAEDRRRVGAGGAVGE